MEKRELQELFERVKQENLSLDETIEKCYQQQQEQDLDAFRKSLLSAVGIDEYAYYTREVYPPLKKHVEQDIFSEYEKNDKAHGIIHIREVIRRSFALNDTLRLHLDKNIIYAVAACHDWGKYLDHEHHEQIAANLFYADEKMKEFFSEEERTIIKEAIQDHRSSFEDIPRSDYGKLISSADQNTRVEIVFIRSFFVGKWRTPDRDIEDFLDYTYHRLQKRYSEENPENMFFEDETFRRFLQEMRTLLKDEVAFKEKYCEVNHIFSRKARMSDYPGVSLTPIEVYTIENQESFLRQKSKEVDFHDPELKADLACLEDYCQNHDVLAMAAVQLGILKRIIYLKNTDLNKIGDDNYDEGQILINPIMKSQEGLTEYWEACASCMDNTGLVLRPYKIKLEYQDETGKKHEKSFRDFASTVVSHEYDHLNGIFHMDVAEEVRQMSAEERKVFRESLGEKRGYKVYVKKGNYQALRDEKRK